MTIETLEADFAIAKADPDFQLGPAEQTMFLLMENLLAEIKAVHERLGTIEADPTIIDQAYMTELTNKVIELDGDKVRDDILMSLGKVVPDTRDDQKVLPSE